MHGQRFSATAGVRKWWSVIDGCGSWPQKHVAGYLQHAVRHSRDTWVEQRYDHLFWTSCFLGGPESTMVFLRPHRASGL